MDPKPAKYAVRDDRDIIDLVTRFPFAWIVSSGGGFGATPLPLRPRFDSAGRLVAFAGHFGRGNAQIARLREEPRALLLFVGPHGYISPSWMADRTQAPSWNYASVAFDCALSFVDDAPGIEALLRDLIDTMEEGRDKAWTMDEMGERKERTARGVVGFRAEILDVQAAFKLGQDERDDVYADILRGLDGEGQNELTDLMRALNPGRG